MNPLQMLRSCINDLHQLMQAMPDAQHVQQVNQALSMLLKIQSELSQSQQQPNPRQAMLQSIAGGQ